MSKIWIVNPFTNKVMQVDDNDPRIAEKRDTDLAWFKFAEHGTLEEIRARPLWHRRTAHDAYRYAEWGSTEEELCDRYNQQHYDGTIARARQIIAEEEARIVALEKAKLRPKHHGQLKLSAKGKAAK